MMLRLRLLLFALLFFVGVLAGPYLHLQGGRIDIRSVQSTKQSRDVGTSGLCLVRLAQYCTPSDVAYVESRLGVKLIRYVPERSYAIPCSKELLETASKLDQVAWVGRLSSSFKISKDLSSGSYLKAEGTSRRAAMVSLFYDDRSFLSVGKEMQNAAVRHRFAHHITSHHITCMQT
jgi:hypothetical protein